MVSSIACLILLNTFTSFAWGADLRLMGFNRQSATASDDTELASRGPSRRCQPFATTFSAHGEVSGAIRSAGFVGVSPKGSYETTSSGLQLFLGRPKGTVHTKDNVNDKLAEGATLNSTFSFLYGRVTFQMQAPTVAGIVTAAILISDEHDEIDVELLGSQPSRWQSNIYAPTPKDKEPLWGVFGEVHTVGHGGYITGFNNYTIDWTEERIEWLVNNRVVRTIAPEDTIINGTRHYPSHEARIQLGIWDASSPAGTSEWANGPIEWDNAPSPISATVKSVRVECY